MSRLGKFTIRPSINDNIGDLLPVRAAFGALSAIHLILDFSLLGVVTMYVIFFDDLRSTEDTLDVSGLFLGPELLLISGLFTFGEISH